MKATLKRPDQIKAYLDKYVVGQAETLGTGACGLRNIMEQGMRDIMFNAPKLAASKDFGEIKVTRGMLTGGAD